MRGKVPYVRRDKSKRRFRDAKPRNWVLCIKDPCGKHDMFNYTEGLRYIYKPKDWGHYNVKVWPTPMSTIMQYNGCPRKFFDAHFEPVELKDCSRKQLISFLDQHMMCAFYEWEAIRTWIYQFYWFNEMCELVELIDPEYTIRPKISIRTFAVESRVLIQHGLTLLG